ncbi:MAG: VWA domain-containing protein [Bradymonadaceae bacterium]
MRFALGREGNAPVVPSSSGSDMLTPEQLEFQKNSSYLFESPDRLCTPKSSSSGDKVTCQVGECSVAGDFSDTSLKRCNAPTSISVDSVEYASSRQLTQRFGLLIENVASLEGFYPSRANTAFYDANGDGQAEKPPITNGNPGYASDPSDLRAAALQEMLPRWQGAVGVAQGETHFGFWAIRSKNAPVSTVAEATGESDQVWTTKRETIAKAVTEQFDTNSVQTGSRAEIWQAIETVLEQGYTASEYEGQEKILTVVVDGPPELPPSSSGTDPSKVIAKANKHNVKVFFIQFDPPVESEENQVLIRDDPAYYKAQSGTCSSDSDCTWSWETCREVRGYSSQPDGDVTSSINGTGEAAGTWGSKKRNFQPKSYCMPERGPNGRFGPVQLFARLACRTGGGYRYLKTAADLKWAMRWLPYTMDGLWEAEATVSKFQNGQFLNGQPIRLQTRMSVELDGRKKIRALSQQGAERDPNAPESGDNRSVVFTKSR